MTPPALTVTTTRCHDSHTSAVLYCIDAYIGVVTIQDRQQSIFGRRNRTAHSYEYFPLDLEEVVRGQRNDQRQSRPTWIEKKEQAEADRNSTAQSEGILQLFGHAHGMASGACASRPERLAMMTVTPPAQGTGTTLEWSGKGAQRPETVRYPSGVRTGFYDERNERSR